MFGWLKSIIRGIKRFFMMIIQFFMSKTLFYVPKVQNKIALSIDDSPRGSTLDILNLLDNYGIKATFFIIGENAEERPEVVREIINRGHEIGNHSIIDEPSFRNSEEEFRDHVGRTKEIIDRFTEQPSKLFRAGSGLSFYWMYPILEELGYSVVVNNKTYNVITTSAHAFDVNVPRSWVDGFCSWILNISTMSGDIIDIHDRDYTQTELKNVIEGLMADGYQLCKISDLIADNNQM